METKTCSTCGVTRELSEFAEHCRARDGRQSVCRACDRERAKRWRAANREYNRLYQNERNARKRQESANV